MTVTNHPAALAYARQRGVEVEGPSLSTEGTNAELLARCKSAGIKATTKMRREMLVSLLDNHNRSGGTVDTDKLSVAQRRRLRRKYGIAA